MQYFFSEKIEYTDIPELLSKFKSNHERLVAAGKKTTQTILNKKQTSQDATAEVTTLNELLTKLAKNAFIIDLISNIAKVYKTVDKDTKNITYYKNNKHKLNQEALDSINVHFQSQTTQSLDDRISTFISKIENKQEESISKLQGYYDRRKYAAHALRVIGIILMLSAIVALFTAGFDAALALLIIGVIVHQSRKFFTNNIDLSSELKEKTDTKNIDLKAGTYIDMWKVPDETNNLAEELKETLNSLWNK